MHNFFNPLTREEKRIKKGTDSEISELEIERMAVRRRGGSQEELYVINTLLQNIRYALVEYERFEDGETVRKLGDFLNQDHPLVKAYPWIKDVDIFLTDLPPWTGGQAFADASKGLYGIYLEATESPEMKYHVFLHELQHLIQEYEDFARGGQPMSKRLSRAKQNLKVPEEDLIFVELDADIPDDEDAKEYYAASAEAYDMYNRLAGETEARNASVRRTQLTAEQRAAIPPWETEDVKEDEQIVRFEVVASFSAKKKSRLPSKGRYNAGADNAGSGTDSLELHKLTHKSVAPIREFAMSISKSGAKSPANFMRGLISALGSKEKNVDKSQYFGISTPDGKFVSLRIANHRASAKTYRNKGVTTDDNLSLVVKMSEKSFQPHRGVRLTELVYFSDKLTAEREVSIANAVAALIDGDDIAFPEADQTNVSPHGIDDGIKFSFSEDSLGIATLEDAKVADAEYKAVVARYTNPDGTKKEGWMKAPNGKPTNLTERQWVQVRTPAFKRWFGDWEKSLLQSFLEHDVVASATGHEFEGVKRAEIENSMRQLFKLENGVAENPELGPGLSRFFIRRSIVWQEVLF